MVSKKRPLSSADRGFCYAKRGELGAGEVFFLKKLSRRMMQSRKMMRNATIHLVNVET